MTTATVPVPSPLAVDAAVTIDYANLTLIVRRPETAGGGEKLLWREAHQALKAAAEAGWPSSGHPFLWGGAFRNRQIVHGQPGDNLTLLFTFPVGESVYGQLVSRPGLYAIVTADRGLRRFLGVRFLNRGLAV